MKPPHEKEDSKTRYERVAPPAVQSRVDAERAKNRRAGFIVLGALCIVMPTLWIISVVRHGPIDTMMPAPPPLGGSAPHAQPLDIPRTVVEYENEIVITPANAARPSHHDVAFSIGSILPDAKKCMEGFGGTAFVSWQVNPDGSATDVRFETPPGGLNAGPLLERTCLPATIQKATVAPFDGPPVRVTYPFRIAITAQQMAGITDAIMGGKGSKASGSDGGGGFVIVPVEGTH